MPRQGAVLILSNTQLFRETLAAALRHALAPVRVQDAASLDASSLPEAPARAGVASPTLILIDADDPAGLATARRLRQDCPLMPCLAFCIGDRTRHAAAWGDIGVQVHSCRDLSLRDLLALIGPSLNRRTPGDPTGPSATFRPIHGAPGPARSASLTAREEEVVRLIMAGESNKEIARTLGISIATVKSHVHNLLNKLGLERRGKLAVWREGREPVDAAFYAE